jgi:hypothetical protein
MRCHWCGQEFQKAIYYDQDKKKVERNYYECPENHGEVHFNMNGEIVRYTFFFFSDEAGSKRYKIEQRADGPVILYIRNIEKKGRGYQKVLEIPNPPPMEIKDDIPQVQRMYERLKKLAFFA